MSNSEKHPDRIAMTIVHQLMHIVHKKWVDDDMSSHFAGWRQKNNDEMIDFVIGVLDETGYWRSVDKELPDEDSWSSYLTISEEGYMDVHDYNGEKDWYADKSDSGLITHWQPLPEPPINT